MNVLDKLNAERNQLNAQIAELESRRDSVEADITAWKRWNVYNRPRSSAREELLAQRSEDMVIEIARVFEKNSPFLDLLTGGKFPNHQ